MKQHRWPQFSPIEFTIGQRSFIISTPRRPMRRQTWAFSLYSYGVRILGIDFQIFIRPKRN